MAQRAWSWYLGQNTTEGPLEGDGTPPKVPDQAWERVTKAVPVEIVGAYTAAVPIASLVTGLSTILLLGLLILGLIGTYFAMTILREVKPSNPDAKLRRIARIQILIALLAFLVWAYAQGGFFRAFTFTTGVAPDQQTYMLYHDGIAALAAIIVSVVIVFADKITGANKSG